MFEGQYIAVVLKMAHSFDEAKRGGAGEMAEDGITPVLTGGCTAVAQSATQLLGKTILHSSTTITGYIGVG